jgi:hypothetical protein
MQTFISTVAFLIWIKTFSQKVQPVIYDSTDEICKFIGFSKVDTVSLWNYELDMEWSFRSDTISPPIGRISFFRTHWITNYWGQLRKPFIRYDIYPTRDSQTAFKQSRYLKHISSCFPLRGGEILHVGKFHLCQFWCLLWRI